MPGQLLDAPVAPPPFYSDCLGNWNLGCVGGQSKEEDPADSSEPKHWYFIFVRSVEVGND